MRATHEDVEDYVFLPCGFDSWPVEHRAGWFAGVLNREGLLREFRKVIGPEFRGRSAHVGTLEVGKAVEVLTDGDRVVSITNDRARCLRAFREEIDIEHRPRASHVRNDELAKFLAFVSPEKCPHHLTASEYFGGWTES